jgi:hypothetical protein
LKNLGKTCAKNKVDVLSITAKHVPDKNKKIAWITARQHPGEVTSSFMV